MLIDFGLARKYVGEDGAHMAPRSDASFRGSTTYASVHAHRNEDLSRRDDLWSWFYMLTELVEGEAGFGGVWVWGRPGTHTEQARAEAGRMVVGSMTTECRVEH